MRDAVRQALPGLCVAVAACAASALEAPAYGPGAGGVVYLLLPPLALQMLIFCAASLIARQWLRAAAFAVALAACVLCFSLPLWPHLPVGEHFSYTPCTLH